jgi:hypothetical protein
MRPTPAETPTLTPTRPPSTAAADAAQVVLGLVEHLVPIHERPTLHPRLHVAAQTLLGALHGGASIHEVVTALVTATAPPVEAPPFEPWLSLLSMTFGEFAESGVGLHVALPKLGEGIWLTSDEAIQKTVVRETGLWTRFIKDIGWMRVEADRLKLPDDQLTVGPFIAALGGKVIGWRGPEVR